MIALQTRRRITALSQGEHAPSTVMLRGSEVGGSARREPPPRAARPIRARNQGFVRCQGCGTLPPSRRALESPIAMACLRFFTRFPERPERSSPRFISCMARSTFSPALRPYLREPPLRELPPRAAPLLALPRREPLLREPPVFDLERELPPVLELERELPPVLELERELPLVLELERELLPVFDLEPEVPPVLELERELPPAWEREREPPVLREAVLRDDVLRRIAMYRASATSVPVCPRLTAQMLHRHPSIKAEKPSRRRNHLDALLDALIGQ